MAKTDFIIGRELTEVDAVTNSDPMAVYEKIVHGQAFNYPQDKLKELSGRLLGEELYTFINGKRYKVTELQSDGRFTAEADFPL